MKASKKTREVAEFGDFQTPHALALAATNLLVNLGISPASVLEPSCGVGAFVSAAAALFPSAAKIVGTDINPAHLSAARKLQTEDSRIKIGTADFFAVDWPALLAKYEEPCLLLGNPPWVTSAELGALSSSNLPDKSNFHGRSGIEAITGKSNFDISEWMLLRYLDCFEQRTGAIAVLCKTSVARKVLLNAWQRSIPVTSAKIYKIDALAHFGASVDACFFVLEISKTASAQKCCDVFESLEATVPEHTISYRNNHLIAMNDLFVKRQNLIGGEPNYIWRSGIKHDCSKVMELRSTPNGYINGFGEPVCIEGDFLYPMLKSSDIGNGRLEPRYSMLVTQRLVGEDTNIIQRTAPQTWDYLLRNEKHLDRRGSSIYRNKPKFSIFGVGGYSFAPWKISISGLYKSLRFVRVGPHLNKAIVLDDTVNFLSFASEDEADFFLGLLTSPAATEFFHSMIWWDEKRPITIEILKRLHLGKLACELGKQEAYEGFVQGRRLSLKEKVAA